MARHFACTPSSSSTKALLLALVRTQINSTRWTRGLKIDSTEPESEPTLPQRKPHPRLAAHASHSAPTPPTPAAADGSDLPPSPSPAIATIVSGGHPAAPPLGKMLAQLPRLTSSLRGPFDPDQAYLRRKSALQSVHPPRFSFHLDRPFLPSTKKF